MGDDELKQMIDDAAIEAGIEDLDAQYVVVFYPAKARASEVQVVGPFVDAIAALQHLEQRKAQAAYAQSRSEVAAAFANKYGTLEGFISPLFTS